MPQDKHYLEQLRLHYHSTIVKHADSELGIAYIEELEDYNTPDEAFWRYRTATKEYGWGSLQNEGWEQFEFNPHYPESGYYQTDQGVVFYTRSGKRQWQHSFSTSKNHSLLYRLNTPLKPYNSLIDPSDAHLAHALFYPEYEPLETSWLSLMEPFNFRRRRPLSYALSNKMALISVYPNRFPVLMYRQAPVGYINNHLEAVLAPGLDEFQHDIGNYMEVKVS